MVLKQSVDFHCPEMNFRQTNESITLVFLHRWKTVKKKKCFFLAKKFKVNIIAIL